MDDWWKRARNSDPETSHLAAASLNVNKRQMQVLEIMATRPDYDWSAGEIDRAAPNSGGLWKRVNELRAKNLVHCTGRKVGLHGKEVETFRLGPARVESPQGELGL